MTDLAAIRERDLNIGGEPWNQKIITDAPPIANKFIGQPLGNLVGWMKRQGDFVMEPPK